MDRTSILGDTIDYMKELLERIRQLQEEMEQQQTPGALSVFRELNPNEMLARNTPKVKKAIATSYKIEMLRRACLHREREKVEAF